MRTRSHVGNGVSLERETLTDGSHVFNVLLYGPRREDDVRFGCVDEPHALALAHELRRSVAWHERVSAPHPSSLTLDAALLARGLRVIRAEDGGER
jgi:hypothetical protein